MKNNNLLILTSTALIILIGGVIVYRKNNDLRQPGRNSSEIANFEQCMDAGNPVMESYPRKCSAAGNTFVEDIGNELDKQDEIRINMPRPNQVVKSPLDITGEARGNWYFEAQFPVRILDADGNELASASVSAQADWMTEDFVPYSGELIFDPPDTQTGTLIMERANPSGLSENADELRVPVKFSE